MQDTPAMNHARQAVAKGVQLLDDKVPGWWRVINLDTLKMSSCTQCMLGQLFGHNVETALGAKMFNLDIDQGFAEKERGDHMSWRLTGYGRGMAILERTANINTGRSIGCDRTDDDCDYSYTDLKCAWAEVIATRRAAEGSNEGESEPSTTSGNSAAIQEGSKA